MAKKVMKLSFLDIVMGAEAETIKSAYEAKIRIDEQLLIREEAYRRIAEVEEKIEEIVGSQGQFVFPAPPLPVAGISKPVESTRSVARKAKPFQTDAPEKDGSSTVTPLVPGDAVTAGNDPVSTEKKEDANGKEDDAGIGHESAADSKKDSSGSKPKK